MTRIAAFSGSTTEKLSLKNTFTKLPESFYTRLAPTPVPEPYLVCASPSAAALIGMDVAEFGQREIVETFAGNRVLHDTQPLAAVYSGHQFGVWAGQLGDGRAVLRSSIREFLCSEAMAALGIPTTRALCVIGSDLPVIRETVETAAVVTRMSPSFVRFGSFEHWYYNQKDEELKVLADYVIDRHYPELRETQNPYLALLAEVTRRTAHLIAQWQAVGFMHGVMNTDNMSILGLTIDYGPFGFMEAFDVHHICNHSDTSGRYAYDKQPQIAHWNCFALGQALLPLIGSVEAAQEALDRFRLEFGARLSELLHAKLGMQSRHEEDDQLFESMFGLMHANRADFTLFFRCLGDLKLDDASHDVPLRDMFLDRPALDAWLMRYRARLRQENSSDEARRTAMNAINPKYVLRNYLAQVAIEKAQQEDFSEVKKLLEILEHPYDEQPENSRYAEPAPDWAGNLAISCSS